jgi:hypothetical protein
MNIKKWKFRFGIVVILISIAVFFVLFAIPFLSISVKTKLALTPALLVAGEVLFWLGIVLIGKDVYLKFKAALKSGEWLSKKGESD